MMRTLVFAALVAFAASEKASFENYQVFRVVPENLEQLELLNQLEGLNEGVSDFSFPSFSHQPQLTKSDSCF